MLTRENVANTVCQNVGAATLVSTLTKVNFCQRKFSKFSLPQLKAVPFKTKAVFFCRNGLIHGREISLGIILI